MVCKGLIFLWMVVNDIRHGDIEQAISHQLPNQKQLSMQNSDLSETLLPHKLHLHLPFPGSIH
jgi:hypothetical protein